MPADVGALSVGSSVEQVILQPFRSAQPPKSPQSLKRPVMFRTLLSGPATVRM